jgi:hypothetical protein
MLANQLHCAIDQTMKLDASIPLSPAVLQTYAAYDDGRTPANGLRMADYRRWSVVLDRLDQGDLLDIGIGMGQFCDAAVRSRRFTRVRGADRKLHSGYRNFTGFEFVNYDLAQPPCGLSAQIVTCLECIEHIQDPTFNKAVHHLKMIATERLVLTVPFEEPEPISRYHHQRFTLDRLTSLFPDATFEVMDKGGGASWALVDIHKSG